MPEVRAHFPDAPAAEAVQRRLSASGWRCRVVAGGADLGKRETRFIGRIVVLVALWSVFGTALGAGMGVAIATVFGPDGTDGLIIQAVSWAIFAHLLGGMWAGYWLLADRSREEMPIPGEGAVLLVVECDSIDDADAAMALLRELGASEVTSETTATSR